MESLENLCMRRDLGNRWEQWREKGRNQGGARETSYYGRQLEQNKTNGESTRENESILRLQG